MVSADKSILIVGKIGATHGIKGWLKVQSYTEYGPNIVNYQPWLLSNAAGGWDSVTLENSQIQPNAILIKLANVNTPEEARLYTGKTIAIDRAQLPQLAKNEFYWSDLEGLHVINMAGVDLGVVTYLMETGANDVLVVKGEREHAIPYLMGSVIKKIDLENKQILVDWEII